MALISVVNVSFIESMQQQLQLLQRVSKCVLCFRRKHCNRGVGGHPLYVNVNMWTGDTVNNWVDSLQAAWAGVQVRYTSLLPAN